MQIVAQEAIPQGSTDVREVVLRVARKNPEVILIAALPPLGPVLIRRLREIAPHQVFTGYFENLSELDTIEGIPFVSQYNVAPWFADLYRARFNTLPISRAPHGFDIIGLLATALTGKSRSPTASEIAAALMVLPETSGATGTLRVIPPRTIANEPV